MDSGLPINVDVVNDLGRKVRVNLDSKSCGCIELGAKQFEVEPEGLVEVPMVFDFFHHPATISHYVNFTISDAQSVSSTENTNGNDFTVAIQGNSFPTVWAQGEFSTEVRRGESKADLGSVFRAFVADGVRDTPTISSEPKYISVSLSEPTPVEFSEVGIRAWKREVRAEFNSQIDFDEIFRNKNSVSGSFTITFPDCSPRTIRYTLFAQQLVSTYPNSIILRGEKQLESVRLTGEHAHRISNVRITDPFVRVRENTITSINGRTSLELTFESSLNVIRHRMKTENAMFYRTIVELTDHQDSVIARLPVYVWGTSQ